MHKHLSRIDLNLLIALQVLLEERNTARAAERLSITQSAMSRTLGRLRVTFEDELFTRQPRGLTPTEKAEALSESLSKILDGIHDIVPRPVFDPKAAVGEVHLGLPEPLALFVVPKLIDRIGSAAPNLILSTHSIVEDYRDLLESGLLDFLVYQQEEGRSFHTQFVGRYSGVCLMREDHPLADTHSVDEESFLSHKHITYKLPLVNSEAVSGFLEKSLTSSNNCILETTQALVASEILLKENAIMLGIPGMKDLAIFGGQVLEKSITGITASAAVPDIYLTQHKRSLDLPLHQWLVDQIIGVVSDVFPAKTEI